MLSVNGERGAFTRCGRDGAAADSCERSSKVSSWGGPGGGTPNHMI